MKRVLTHFATLILGFIPMAFTSADLKAATKEYTVGVVPQYDTRKIYQDWRPILDSLSKETKLIFTLSLSKNIPMFEKQFIGGEFDIAYMNPYHLIVANRKQGYIPLAKDVKKKLFGIIVVRKDSPFQNIYDLDGETIAFPAPNALGAALIPRAEFAGKFKIKIVPKYVRSHTSVYLNVILRQAGAGGGVLKTFQQQDATVRNQLKVLYKTSEAPPHPIAIHPRVSKEDRRKILQALLKIGETGKGKAMLQKIPISQIGKAELSDYDELKKMGLEDFYVN